MQTRRRTLQQGASVAALLAGTGLFPTYALALNAPAFKAKKFK
jgi:sulfur-oxidizing protein SoxY